MGCVVGTQNVGVPTRSGTVQSVQAEPERVDPGLNFHEQNMRTAVFDLRLQTFYQISAELIDCRNILEFVAQQTVIHQSEMLSREQSTLTKEVRTTSFDENKLEMYRESQQAAVLVLDKAVDSSADQAQSIPHFDPELDDDEIISAIFKQIDADGSGSIEKTELLAVLEQQSDQDVLVNALMSLLKDGEAITFAAFKTAAKEMPRVKGQRCQWCETLGLASGLARHLKPGTLFDGLAGIRDCTSHDELMQAVASFSAELPQLVAQGAARLRRSRDGAAPTAEDVNHKFAVTEGAFTGAFGSLEDFYSPEGRLGHPNPNFLEAMRTEHAGRLNAAALFTTPNYGITTCPHYEWLWVMDPDLAAAPDPPPAGLLVRLGRSGGRFPGEVGDEVSQVEVGLVVATPDAGAAAAMARAMNEELAREESQVFPSLAIEWRSREGGSAEEK